VPGDKRDGPPATEGPPRSGTATSTALILPETPDQRARRLARERLANQHRRLRHARLAEEAMSPVAYYCGPRRWAA
jgi:hypothetical protein